MCSLVFVLQFIALVAATNVVVPNGHRPQLQWQPVRDEVLHIAVRVVLDGSVAWDVALSLV